jgi:N-terminal acetyltransferase B complex non-catalytic subunit
MDAILRNGDPQKMSPVRLNYLQNPFLGPDSKIAKGEWQLWRLKLDLLKKDPELLFQTTSDLLKRARTKSEAGDIAESRFSDWKVWESYIGAALLDKPTYRDEVEAEIKAHLDPKSGIDKSWRRNASLASLKFALTPTSSFSSFDTPDYKTDLIVQYLQQYGNTNVAYTDLRTVISSLDSQDLDRLLSILLQSKSGASEALNDGEIQPKGSLSPLNQDVSMRIFISLYYFAVGTGSWELGTLPLRSLSEEERLISLAIERYPNSSY